MIRLVGQIFLAVTLEHTLYDDNDLATLFAEVEATVNWRSLTDALYEVGEPTSLFPKQLFCLNAAVAKPFLLPDEFDKNAQKCFEIVQYAAH